MNTHSTHNTANSRTHTHTHACLPGAYFYGIYPIWDANTFCVSPYHHLQSVTYTLGVNIGYARSDQFIQLVLFYRIPLLLLLHILLSPSITAARNDRPTNQTITLYTILMFAPKNYNFKSLRHISKMKNNAIECAGIACLHSQLKSHTHTRTYLDEPIS